MFSEENQKETYTERERIFNEAISRYSDLGYDPCQSALMIYAEAMRTKDKELEQQASSFLKGMQSSGNPLK